MDAAMLTVAGGLLLSGCSKNHAGVSGSGDSGNPDGAVSVGCRSGALTVAGPSGADDGWGTSATGARSASTRAGVPPTGMVEGAFQIGDLWVDGNRGRSVEKPMTWAEATQYCADLGLRLPTHDEMESIISYVRSNSPLPDNRKFEYYLSNGTRHNYYWTSTPRSADASYVWGAFLHLDRLGLEGLNAAEDDVSARCVKREGEEILPPAPDPGPDVEHPDGLPVGTTFRVVVYEAGADPQSDSPVDQNTYKIADAKGTIVASAVDEFGNATDDASRELVLRRGAYDFYYFSPAVPASTSMPNPGRYTDLTNGADYMALAQREVIDPSQGPKHYIPEVCFYRMGSYIDVRISPREGEIMGTLEVTGDGLQLWGLPGSGRYEIGDYPYRLITEGSGGMVEFSPADFAAEEGTTTTVATLGTGGGRAVLPGYARDLQVKVTLTSDGKEMKLDASLAGHNFAPGYRYVVELGVGRIADNPELSIDILPWNEYDWGDDSEIGGRPFQTAVVTPEGDIPGTGGTYSVLLEGTVLVEGVTVRASSGGAVLASGRVAALGTPVELTVPANESSEVRSVVFEYQWGGLWLNIGAARLQYPAAFDTGGSATVLEYRATYDMYRTYSEAVDYCSSKGEGWRLPTQNEMMYYWCVAPACDSDPIGWMSDYGAADYWTTTMYEGQQQQFDMTLGSYVWKSSSIFARCVKDRTDSKKRYPYVTTASDGGVVVVLRDDEGGLDPAALFPERVTESRTGDVSSEDNRMAAKFRVQRAQLEAITASEIIQGNAVTYCNDLVAEGYSDWRLPSQREMTMLYVLGCSESVDFGQQNTSGVGPETVQPIGSPYLYQQPGFTQFAHAIATSTDTYTDYYAIANAIGSSTKFWMMAPVYGYVYQLNKPGSSLRQRFWFRCVRDEDGSAPVYTVSEASVTPAGDIPAEGKAVSLTLTGDLPSAGVEVRAQSGGTALVTGKVTASGTAVSLAVPANRSFDSRTVTFEYNLNGMWTPIGDSRSQAGYSVSDATHTAPATIPGPGATYSVTLTGVLPADGVEVRAQSGGTVLVTGKVTASGTAVSLTVPANATGADRTVTF